MSHGFPKKLSGCVEERVELGAIITFDKDVSDVRRLTIIMIAVLQRVALLIRRHEIDN